MPERTIPQMDPDVLGDLAHGHVLPVNVRLKEANWEDLRVPLTATKGAGVKDPGFGKIGDDGAGSTGVYAYLFDKDAEEELFFHAQIPHAFKWGTEIRPHVHWKATTAGAGSVVWGLELAVANMMGDFSDTTIIWVAAPAAGVTARHMVANLPPVSGSGLRESAMLICRAFRDATSALATDDYDADAAFLEIDFHLQVDRMGTVDEFSAP